MLTPHGRHDERGSTLVEVLVVLVLTSAIGGVVMTSIVQTMRVTSHAQERTHELNRLQTVIQRIGREVRVAQAIYIDPDGAGDCLGVLVDRADASHLYAYEHTPPDASGTRQLRQDRHDFITPDADPAHDVPHSEQVTTLIEDTANDGLSPAPPTFRYFDRDGREVTAERYSDRADADAAYRAGLLTTAHVEITLSTALDDRDPLRVQTRAGVRATRAANDAIIQSTC